MVQLLSVTLQNDNISEQRAAQWLLGPTGDKDVSKGIGGDHVSIRVA